MNSTAELIDYPGEKLYTIGTVSKLTGVGAITLRAWERRYGLIEPVRKESGHRLYTRRHIDQINRITALTQQGMRISQIRPEMLESGAETDAGPDGDKWRDSLNSMMAAIISFDEDRLEEIYNEALSLYPIGLVTRKLLRRCWSSWACAGKAMRAALPKSISSRSTCATNWGRATITAPAATAVPCCWSPACPGNTTKSDCCSSRLPPMSRVTAFCRWARICH